MSPSGPMIPAIVIVAASVVMVVTSRPTVAPRRAGRREPGGPEEIRVFGLIGFSSR
jgi:hypothetical protein